MQQTHARRYLEELDVVRALAILGVLIVHATADIAVGLAGQGRLYPLYVVLNRMGKVGTPTFIFLSSVVLFYGYSRTTDTGGVLRRFYRRRLHLVAVPYLIWSAFYYIHRKFIVQPVSPLASADAWQSLLDSMSWGEFITRLANGTAYYHLYFVVISLQFYLLFPFLLLAFRGGWLAGSRVLWAGIVLQWVAYGVSHLWFLKFASYLSFYGLGMMVAKNPEGFVARLQQPLVRGWRRLAKIHVITSAWLAMGIVYSVLYGMLWAGGPAYHVALYDLAWNGYTLLSCVVLYFCGFALYRRLHKATAQRIAAFGRTAFGIYILHPIVLYVWQRHHPFSSSPLLVVAGGFLLITVVSWLVVAASHIYLPRVAPLVFGASNPRLDRNRLEAVPSQLPA